MVQPPDATSDAATVALTVSDLGDGLMLLKEPPARGAPSGLHDFALIRDASNDEIRQYYLNYTPEVDSVRLSRRELYQYQGGIRNAMLGGYEWRNVLQVIAERCRQSAENNTLVSLVFCSPESLVFRDLEQEYAYFQERSGEAWDLHFIGYRCEKRWSLRPSQTGIPKWRFDAKRFNAIRAVVQSEHLRHIHNVPLVTPGWRYWGRPELVSFMAYGSYDEFDEPRAHIDWPSLRAVPLVDASGGYIDYSLGEIVEAMSDWRDQETQVLRDLAPGELPIATSAGSIVGALKAVASVLASGIAGNAVYELIKKAIGV